jgi:hypothetical protein
MEEFVGDLNIRFDVQFLVAQSAGMEIHLFEVYRVAPDVPIRVRMFGTSQRLLANPAHTYVYHRRKSMEGYLMKIASLNVSRR